jgi:hypothetical protein
MLLKFRQISHNLRGTDRIIINGGSTPFDEWVLYSCAYSTEFFFFESKVKYF